MTLPDESAAGPVFHAAPQARGLLDDLAALLPGEALIWAPGAGALAVLALYLVTEARVLSRAGGR